MNNRQIAAQFAEQIKETCALSDVKVCWNLDQAKKHGLLAWIPDTVAFACVCEIGDGDSVTSVIPIAKRVLFQKDDNGERIDNFPVLLASVGRFIINHFELEMRVEEMRAVSEVLYG